jgi:hypothetical protein
LNPVEAGIVSDPAHYPWSSHAAYCGRPGPAWLTTAHALEMFATDASRARRAYRRFMRDGDGQAPVRPETDAPVAPISSEAESQPRATPYAVRSPRSLEDLVVAECEAAAVSPALLASPTKTRVVSDVRVRIASEAVRSQLATLEELGALFGRSASAVSKLLLRHTRLCSPGLLRVRLESGVSGGAGRTASTPAAGMSNTGTGQECPTPAPVKRLR